MVARAAAAPFVARMDADDVSHPERLAEELRLLRADPEIGVVASVSDMIDASGRKMRQPELWRLARRSVFVPFAHGAMMYRRDIFERVGGYRDLCEYWEDQDLVLRMARIAKIVVIPRPLYRWRQSTTSTRLHCRQERLERALDRAYRATDRLKDGIDYEAVLARPGTHSAKVDPRVFIASGSVHLWAGGQPRLFRRILSRGKLSWNFQSAAALAWTAWASASPSSLRAFLMFLLRMRNRLTSRSLPASRAVIWQPLGNAELVERACEERVVPQSPCPNQSANLMVGGNANRASAEL
jgi:hypothetical protein